MSKITIENWIDTDRHRHRCSQADTEELADTDADRQMNRYRRTGRQVGRQTYKDRLAEDRQAGRRQTGRRQTGRQKTERQAEDKYRLTDRSDRYLRSSWSSRAEEGEEAGVGTSVSRWKKREEQRRKGRKPRETIESRKSAAADDDEKWVGICAR